MYPRNGKQLKTTWDDMRSGNPSGLSDKFKLDGGKCRCRSRTNYEAPGRGAQPLPLGSSSSHSRLHLMLAYAAILTSVAS